MSPTRNIHIDEAVSKLEELFGGGPIPRFIGLRGREEAGYYWAAYLRAHTHTDQADSFTAVDFDAIVERLHKNASALDNLIANSGESVQRVGYIKGYIRPFRQLIDPLATEAAADRQILDEKINGGPLHLDVRLKPAGVAYEWKRFSVRGDSTMHSMSQHKTAGWRCVPPSRHPEIFNEGDDGRILAQGMVLMEIPMEKWAELKEMDLLLAKEQVLVHIEKFKGEGFEVPDIDI